MRIGVISDTHDNIDGVQRAIDEFDEHGVQTIIHCGDIVAPPTIDYFDGYSLHAVLGNNDGEISGLGRTIADLKHSSQLYGRFTTLSFDESTFAVLHGESLENVKALAQSREFDYVCYGHHHSVDNRIIDGTTVINPGGFFPTIDAQNQCVAIVDTEDDSVTINQV